MEPSTTYIYLYLHTLALRDALPISPCHRRFLSVSQDRSRHKVGSRDSRAIRQQDRRVIGYTVAGRRRIGVRINPARSGRMLVAEEHIIRRRHFIFGRPLADQLFIGRQVPEDAISRRRSHTWTGVDRKTAGKGKGR